MRNHICLINLLLALLCPAPSFADITFYVRSDGDKGFVIEGDDIKATESVEIKVVYDSAILANPRVSLKTGTVTSVDDSVPGTLIFDANQGDDPGPSFEAQLGFDKKMDIQGGIFSVSGKIIGPDGKISPTRTIPNEPTSASSSLLTATFNYGDSESGPEQSMAIEEATTSGNRADIPVKTEKSIVQRFREFRGERGLKAFAALFERSPRDMPVQEPPVALSDGKTPVRITLPLQPKGENTPNVALSDAKLVHLGKDGAKGWVITALPNAGTWNARLLIKMDERIIEFPLVVAPPVKVAEGVNEQNFLVALDGYLAGQAAARPRASDPSRQYIDEYIFTANCLAKGITTVMAEGN